MDVQRIISGGSYCGSRVAKAIRLGVLQRPACFPCADCGGPATEYDHRDYNEPLLVAPTCRRCNARRGKAIPRRWQAGELLASLRRSLAGYRVVPWAREWCMDRIEHACVRVERGTNWLITRTDLRPDLYPPEEREAA